MWYDTFVPRTGVSHCVVGALERGVVSFAIQVTWGYTCPVLLATVTGHTVQFVAGGRALSLRVCVWMTDGRTEKDASVKKAPQDLSVFFVLSINMFACVWDKAVWSET